MLPSLCFTFFFYCFGDHLDLHSFPTRRSSDLDYLAADHTAEELRALARPELRPALEPHIASARSSSDRKSTRLNSSHVKMSYAVFCLKKKTLRSISVGRRKAAR